MPRLKETPHQRISDNFRGLVHTKAWKIGKRSDGATAELLNISKQTYSYRMIELAWGFWDLRDMFRKLNFTKDDLWRAFGMDIGNGGEKQ